jgi:hypothetical protein
MGTFAKTAIVDYHLSFANQGKQTLFSVSVGSKQTEVCHFRFPFAANKWKLPFSVSFIFRKYIYIYAAVSNRKQKPRQFFLIRSPFAHHANRSLSFVCLLMKKQMEVICLQMY